jgi:putative DNA methylase
LRDVHTHAFSTVLVPKSEELVATPYRFRGDCDEAEAFFLDGMRKAITGAWESAPDHVPATIYYAFKQSEVEREGVVSTGWATFLDAVISSGFQVDGTWPVRTERSVRSTGIGTNALASSIVLVCRKRSDTAPTVSRAEFLRALRRELPPALATLQQAAIAPVDMAQASIGPGMAVFSRYAAVLEADDERMTVKTALALINQFLDEYLAEQEGDFDSRSRFAITWFEQHGFAEGKYGEAEVLAQARDVAVAGVEAAGLIRSGGGKVRLLRRDELDQTWDIRTDDRVTVWECCQHLIRRHDGEGVDGAARLLKSMGHYGEMARDLAYRLFQLCERKKWAEEARAYNALVVAWPDIVKRLDDVSADPLPGRDGRQAEFAL